MSEENVRIVRQLYEHMEQGDWGGGREFYDDDCEVVFSASGFPDPGTYRVGRETLGAWVKFTGEFEAFETGFDQIIEAGGRVVALAWIRGRGGASGADVDAKVGAVFTFREGKIVRFELTSRQEALEAAGLSE